jgi:hypothetical protein
MTDCNCGKGHDSSGFTSGMLLGLVLGAAGVHFLSNSDEGKEILSKLKESTSNALKDLGENPALADKIADLQKTMDQARATINSAAEKVVEATEVKKPEPKKNFFQKMGASLGK